LRLPWKVARTSLAAIRPGVASHIFPVGSSSRSPITCNTIRHQRGPEGVVGQQRSGRRLDTAFAVEVWPVGWLGLARHGAVPRRGYLFRVHAVIEAGCFSSRSGRGKRCGPRKGRRKAVGRFCEAALPNCRCSTDDSPNASHITRLGPCYFEPGQLPRLFATAINSRGSAGQVGGRCPGLTNPLGLSFFPGTSDRLLGPQRPLAEAFGGLSGTAVWLSPACLVGARRFDGSTAKGNAMSLAALAEAIRACARVGYVLVERSTTRESWCRQISQPNPPLD
jgi:hypothetical protein